MDEFEDDDEDWQDDGPLEGDDEDWEEGDSEEAETLPCPTCGALVYELAERCPACGEYVTFSTHPLAGRSPLWIGLGLAGVVALIAALLLVF